MIDDAEIERRWDVLVFWLACISLGLALGAVWATLT